MEAVELASGALDAIMTASGGDMRKAVTFLQSSHQLSAGTPVTVGIVSDISGEVLHENDSSPLRLSFCDRINHELY
jgi:replication factor C subunit 2/4